MITIRAEQPGDEAAIRTVLERAFGRPDEAVIVDRLRISCPSRVSLVAVDADVVVGHVLFTPVTVGDRPVPIAGVGLAPMAVVPERQREGIGSALVRSGMEVLRESGCPFVVVLGHPEYYPRFGFERASRHGIRCQWADVPDAAFLLTIFDAEAMAGVRGVASYAAAFDQVG